jgi:cytochrome P450
MEGKIALSALATRFRHLELTVPQAQLRYKPSTALRGLTSLPMRLR